MAAPTELAGDESIPSERVLMRRALADDQTALRVLYEQHAPRIHRFLRDLFGNVAAADDATQETFARAFRRLGTLREGDRLVPWLFGIARNVFFEMRKATMRDRRPRNECARELDREDRETPEAMLMGREAARIIDLALARLSEDRRAVLLLRVDHGLAYEDVARLMGWSLAKVKVEIHRARRELRAELANFGGSGP